MVLGAELCTNTKQSFEEVVGAPWPSRRAVWLPVWVLGGEDACVGACAVVGPRHVHEVTRRRHGLHLAAPGKTARLTILL